MTQEHDTGHWHCDVPRDWDAIGFVYRITNSVDGRYYIGKKLMFTKKGKKISPSDWKSYTSSSKTLKEAIKINKKQWHFEILSFHNSKSLMAIEEARLQILALHDQENVNGIINLRIRTTHLKNDLNHLLY